MVAKKAKSKRQTARQKYKIIKNVAEKHRKLRKDAKNKPHKKAKKDPGIPNNYPFKEEVLMQAQEIKQKNIDEKLQKKLDKLNAPTVDDILMNDEAMTPSKKTVQKRGYLHFKAVIEESDVVFLAVDCRDPLNSLAIQAQELIMKEKKRVILALTMIDLVPRDAVRQWIKYFEKEYPVVVFTNTEIEKSLAPISKLLEFYGKKVKKDSKFGVIGFPNTGKSTLLEALETLDIELVEAPGIMFSRTTDLKEANAVILRNFSKASSLPDPEKNIQGLLDQFDEDIITQMYKLPPVLNTQDLLMQFARFNGFIRRGGVLDHAGAARKIMQDWYDRKMNVYTLPSGTLSKSNVKKIEKDFGFSKVKKLVDELIESFEEKECIKINCGLTVPVDMVISQLPKGYSAYVEMDQEQEEETMFEDEEEDDEEEDSEMEDDAESEVEEPVVVKKVANKKSKRAAKADDFDFSEQF